MRAKDGTFNATLILHSLPATLYRLLMTKIVVLSTGSLAVDQQSNVVGVFSPTHKVLRRSQMMLLEMATPDAIARLPHTALERRAPHIWNAYFKEQQHSSLGTFMSHVLNLEDRHVDEKRQEGLLIQVSDGDTMSLVDRLASLLSKIEALKTT